MRAPYRPPVSTSRSCGLPPRAIAYDPARCFEAIEGRAAHRQGVGRTRATIVSTSSASPASNNASTTPSAPLGRRRLRASALALCRAEPERDEHVERVTHRAAAVVDELVRALGRRTRHCARDRHHLASAHDRLADREHRPARRTGLDDHDEIGQGSDQTIARGKSPRRRRRAREVPRRSGRPRRRHRPRAARSHADRGRRARCRRRRSAPLPRQLRPGPRLRAPRRRCRARAPTRSRHRLR